MASGSGAQAPLAATPKISGDSSSPNLPSNRELLRLNRSLERPTLSKTTGSDTQNDTAIMHFLSILIYCVIQVYAISQSVLFSTSVYVLDYLYKSKLNNQPSSQDLDGVGHGSLTSERREAADISPRDPREINDRPDGPVPEDIGPEEIEKALSDESEDDAERATCSPGETDDEPDKEHVEAGCVEVVTISDSENDDDYESSVPEEADGNVNDQESESQNEPVQEVEENPEQLGPPPANEYDVAIGTGAQTPISITGGDEFGLTGETLVGSGSVTNTLLPDFSDGFPAPEHKEKQCLHEPSEAVPASEIPKMCSFYDELGWISRDIPKKRCNGALTKKLEKRLSDKDNCSGVLYIRKHNSYNNLYKIGVTTTTMKERKVGQPLCIRMNSSELYTTDIFVGPLRAESLAKIHMTSRNVPLKLCLPCRIGKQAKQAKQTEQKQADSTRQSKTHNEWFTGDYDDIQACVDFWAETVARLYDDDTAAFTGNVDDVLETVLSSEGRRRESRQNSAGSKEHLGNAGPTPCPQRTEAERRPSTGRTDPEEDEETGRSDEMVSDDRKQLWERRDYTVADVGATPKKAARGSNGGRLSVRPEGLQTRSKTKKLKELNTIPLSAEDISRVVG